MINLKALEENQVPAYFEKLWTDYRNELVGAGFSEGYAEENIQYTKKRVLPEGILAPGNHIFYVYSDFDLVGKLWLATKELDAKTEWFVFDIETFSNFRGKGFGREIMKAAEKYVLDSGGTAISLSVFGNNSIARKLYESLEYETIRLELKKKLH